MAKKNKNIKEEFIVDNVGTPAVEPNEAYLTPVTLDKHYRTVADEEGELSVQIDPTVPQHVRNITQGDINNWNSTQGSDKYYEHTQSVPSDHWVVVHNLGKKPSVTVTDSAGRIVISSIQYINNSELHILHSGAFSGKAELN